MTHLTVKIGESIFRGAVDPYHSTKRHTIAFLEGKRGKALIVMPTTEPEIKEGVTYAGVTIISVTRDKIVMPPYDQAN